MNLLIVGRKSKTQMRNMFYWAGIISILICLPLRVSAQSYEQMWKQVEVLEQKQLPKSAIQELRKIYEYAKQEKNVSQMMKAHLTRASLCIDITPDSLDSELSALKAWMEEEKETLKDPYIFDMLTFTDEYDERDVELGLIKHIEKFLLQMGAGFAFMGRQYHIKVSEKDFYIDILMYNAFMHRYLVVELKRGEF